MALVSCLTPAMSGRALAQDTDDVRVAKLKSAFVLNFIRFTQWPDTAFAEEDAPIRTAVVGDAAMLPYLVALTSDEQVQGHPVVVVRIAPPAVSGDREADAREADRFIAELRLAHAVFLPAAQGEHLALLRSAVVGRPVLTVSDMADFVDAGGMLGLVLSRNRMVFDANQTAIRTSGLRVSSKVLRLAQRVLEDE